MPFLIPFRPNQFPLCRFIYVCIVNFFLNSTNHILCGSTGLEPNRKTWIFPFQNFIFYHPWTNLTFLIHLEGTVDVSFVESFFSCKSENLRFLMNIHEVLWFTISKFLIPVVPNKTRMRYLARKDVCFKTSVNSKPVICVN